MKIQTVLFILLSTFGWGQAVNNGGSSGGAGGFIYTGVLSGIPATCTIGQVAFITDATPGQNQYNCTATNTWTQNLNSGSAGANQAISNLSAVSINTSLLAQTGVDAGSTAKPFRNLFLFGAGTYGTTSFELTGTPTAARTITIPDASITLARTDAAQTFTGVQTLSSAPVLSTGTLTSNGVLMTFPTTATTLIGETASDTTTGWSTTCSSTSEVPTAFSPYGQPIPTVGDTGAGMSALPASLYLPSKPSWWGSSLPYPAIGPDVLGGNVGQCSGTLNTVTEYAGVAATSSLCTGTTLNSAWGGHVNTNPAMNCALNVMGMPPDGSNTSPLSFNASTCYGGGGSTRGGSSTSGGAATGQAFDRVYRRF